MYFACGAATFVGGVLISLLNYLISRAVMIKSPNNYAISAVIRQILNVAFLIACYALGEWTELPSMALLVGAALGITLPSLYFTSKLLRLNSTYGKKNQKEGGENTDG